MLVIGRGNTAEVMEMDNQKVCKLFYEGYPYSAVEREYNNAKLMQTMNLPIPKVYEIVNWEKRIGIVYDRLHGQSIMEKLFQGEDVDFLLNQITDLHKEILRCHTSEGMSYKEFLYLCIEKRKELNLDLYNEIAGLPEGDYLCHGDYHPGNIWMSTSGKVLAIDFMNVCHGSWQYDVARSYVLISENEVSKDVPNREEILYMQKQLADMYLEKMQISYNEISKYISIIQQCRKYELL